MTEPTWAEGLGAVAQIVQAAALLVAGVFAYIKLLKGRIFHARLDPEIEAEYVHVKGGNALRITASVVNAGSLRVAFASDCDQRLTAKLSTKRMWDDALTHGEVLWSEGKDCCDQGLLTREGVRDVTLVLEPGEGLRRNLLIPLSDDDFKACWISLEVEARPQHILRTGKARVWKTELVLPRLKKNGQ